MQPRIAPGLATLTDDVLFGDVWQAARVVATRPEPGDHLDPDCDGEAGAACGHLGRALDNGVQPSEASGLLAHLAIYCGWPNAVSALEVYDQVYTARKVDTRRCAPALRVFRFPPRTRLGPEP